MVANEKYLKLTANSGRRFFIRVNGVLSILVTTATQIQVVYAQAEGGNQQWNISLGTAADANAAAEDLMQQIIDLQAAPYTERVRDFSENGYVIISQ